MTCSCCLAGKFHGLNGLSKPSCRCSCPPSCKCGCRSGASKGRRGGCGCSSGLSRGGLSGADCSCGCGGACGCGPKSAMGSFDEYPRPKSALFDPRQIDRVWPEPHPDPLIPYVRANEGLLPYDFVNRYKGQRGSLHGYIAMGSSTSETDAQKITRLEGELQTERRSKQNFASASLLLGTFLFVGVFAAMMDRKK